MKAETRVPKSLARGAQVLGLIGRAMPAVGKIWEGLSLFWRIVGSQHLTDKEF